jgi:hypothetical protein
MEQGVSGKSRLKRHYVPGDCPIVSSSVRAHLGHRLRVGTGYLRSLECYIDESTETILRYLAIWSIRMEIVMIVRDTWVSLLPV